MALICKLRNKMRYVRQLNDRLGQKLFAFTNVNRLVTHEQLCGLSPGSSTSTFDTGTGTQDTSGGPRRQARLMGEHSDGRKVYAAGDCEGCFGAGERLIARWVDTIGSKKVYALACPGCTVNINGVITGTVEHPLPTLCFYHFNCRGVLLEECCKFFFYNSNFDVRSFGGRIGKGDQEPDTFRVCVPISHPVTPLAIIIQNPSAEHDLCLIDAYGHTNIGPGLSIVEGLPRLLDYHEEAGGNACGAFKIRCGPCCDRGTGTGTATSTSTSTFHPPPTGTGTGADCIDPCGVRITADAIADADTPAPMVCITHHGPGGGQLSNTCQGYHVSEEYNLVTTGANYFRVCSSNGVSTPVLLNNRSCTETICLTDATGSHTIPPGLGAVVSVLAADCLGGGSSDGIFSVTCGPC